MTEVANNDENHFSFRMFDLYRRFVEVLRLKPDYLLEFKSGHPREEVCRDIIERIFKNRQTEDNIIHLLKYLNKNAKTIAVHAENIPDNWTDAIKYTDQCIKLIKNYLHSHGINFKKDFNVIELTKDIGAFLHTTPNEVQLQAITDFLINDLRNPKKNIISQASFKKYKKKLKKTGENSKDIKVDDSIEVALEQIFDESINTDKDEESQEMLAQKKIEIQKLLQEGNAESQNELLYIEDNTKSSLEGTIQDALKEESLFGDEDIEIDIESPKYERLETNNENYIDDINESSLTWKGLKRHGHDIGNDRKSIKKLCIPKDYNQQNFQNDKNLPINYSKNDESSEDKKIQISVLCTPENKSIFEDEEANVSQINSYKEDLLNILEDVKVKTEEKNVSLKLDKKTLTLNENFCSECSKNYLNPLNMTYHDAYKLMESVMTFCVLKNETSLEEFLILRRTKDKMHWRSLKEVKKENQYKN